MKKLLYFVYSVFFRLGRLLPVREKLAALVSPHPPVKNDSLAAIKAELIRRGGFSFVEISTAEIKGKFSPAALFRFFVVKPVKLARAEYVFLNDNFMPLADVCFSEKTTVIQLWHGEGAFKKIGLSLDLPEDIEKRERRLYKNYDYAVCSSKSVAFVYREAFDMSEGQVLPLGSPRTDFFFAGFDYAAERSAFDEAHPECRGKKLVLYAPTFRDDASLDAGITAHIDPAMFAERLGDRFALLLKLHPQVRPAAVPRGVTAVTGFGDTGTLLRLADVLVTDYSSICMDFALLDKPVYFYPYDLEEYTAARDFYADYESTVPGGIARDFESLVELIGGEKFDRERLAAFREYHLGACDGGSAARVIEAIIK